MSGSEVGWYLWSRIAWLSAEGGAGTRVSPGGTLGLTISGGFPHSAGCACAQWAALRGVRWEAGAEPGQRQEYRGDPVSARMHSGDRDHTSLFCNREDLIDMIGH